MDKKGVKYEASLVAYMLGIVSVVLAFFQPVAAIVFGIIGLVQGKRQNTALSKTAKKLNIVGIVLGVILFIVGIIVTLYFAQSSLAGTFPVA